MAKFEADIPKEQLAVLESEIEKRIERRKSQLGDMQAAEKEVIGNLLDYGRTSIDDVSYDLFNARKYVKMFPEPDVAAGERPPCLLVRLYQKVVRRLLRQQVVYNQSVLGVLEEHEQRLSELERELKDRSGDAAKGGKTPGTPEA
jgi:hypothetical protein